MGLRHIIGLQGQSASPFDSIAWIRYRRGMQRLLMLMIAAALVGISHAREFKSADGSKTIRADFVRYNPRTGDVTLQMFDGRNMVTKADFFSEEDREFFREQFRESELQGSLSVRGHDKLTRDTRQENRLIISLDKADYIFTVKNKSDVNLENLTLKYWVVVERYNFGNEKNETFSGDVRIAELKAEGEAEANGPSIVLTKGAAPTGNVRDERTYARLLNEAAKYGRDDALGWRVEIFSSDGKLLLADSSSIRVDRVLGKDDKDK